MAIKHGGDLLQIAAHYKSDPQRWTDLSTGVSPFTYPLNEVPAALWNQLPQTDDGLESIAKTYYQAVNEPVVVAGSQAAIMALPAVLTAKLGKCGCVALPLVGYKEHQHAWVRYQQDGQRWQIEYYDDFPSPTQIADCDVLVVINPNNPTGYVNAKQKLQEVHLDLQRRQGYLIVDEAFADSTTEISMLKNRQEMAGLIVLRSVGKFFGLAGARVGFVFAPLQIQTLLSELLGPWTVTGPSRWVVKKALADKAWQEATKQHIKHAALRLNQLLEKYLKGRKAKTDLFITVYREDAVACHHHFCQLQILTRLCDEKNALRFGLPADQQQWQKLENALLKIKDKR